MSFKRVYIEDMRARLERMLGKLTKLEEQALREADMRVLNYRPQGNVRTRVYEVLT